MIPSGWRASVATIKAESDQLFKRMQTMAVDLGGDKDWEECLYSREVSPGVHSKLPRWKVSARWIEFECGCTAERCRDLHQPQPSDPIIFGGQVHQAVYDKVCHKHHASMNARCGMGGQGRTFEQWYRERRRILMGRAR
jgi:hypothetical protein